MQKIYIAGFDVFKKDSLSLGKKYKQLCAKYGFEGLYPLDNEVDFSRGKQQAAQSIFLANKKMIQEADIVIANLNPFRGYESDSGTVWECGYGYGLGKKVYGYLDNIQPYKENFGTEAFCKDGVLYDREGMVIEDFDYPLNLMISCSVTGLVAGGFEDVLKEICA